MRLVLVEQTRPWSVFQPSIVLTPGTRLEITHDAVGGGECGVLTLQLYKAGAKAADGVTLQERRRVLVLPDDFVQLTFTGHTR